MEKDSSGSGSVPLTSSTAKSIGGALSATPPSRLNRLPYANLNALPYAKPALLTGTSSEFLGRRALPKLVRNRACVFIIGPDGSGKTRAALRIARHDLSSRSHPKVLDGRQLQKAVLDRVRKGSWSSSLLRAKALILDGPVWLRQRQGVVVVLAELIRMRCQASKRTVVVQSDSDGSVDVLMDQLECGVYTVVGLRFPKGPRGKLRFARRMCDERDVSRDAARGTQHLVPWGYGCVIDYVESWSPPTDA